MTYTYKPLVGISSITDQNNKTQFYEYDNLKRLALVRDKDNNILKKICYNYAGQIENCVSACPPDAPANWQNTATPPTCQQGACGNTGYQLQEQVDINPCSPSHNQVQWVIAGYNPTACSLPTCVNLTSTNVTGASGYTATYTNNAYPYTVYSFAVPTATGLQSLGSIPEGSYTLSITRTTGTPSYATFKSGCFKQTITDFSAIFYNVAVSSVTCNSIYINT